MKILRTLSSAAIFRNDPSSSGSGPLVLVPTMGALHAGHLALARKARTLAGKTGRVVVSIFVNPAQFGPGEDFSRYPRTFRRDCRLCAQAGVDAVFHPAPGAIYPEAFSTCVQETRLSLALCGKSRPGHFRGVCTVVLKLFNILEPDIAVFGEKDYQQVAVIRRMVADLNIPVRIVTAPTVRERDGLAMSSRNAYLSPPERAQAPVLRRALLLARAAKFRTPSALGLLVSREIATAPLAKVDYVEVLDARTLDVPRAHTRDLVIACAVWFGNTRLIDNIRLKNSKATTRRPRR